MATTCNECGSIIPPGLPAYLLNGRELCRNCRDESEPQCPNCGEVMRRKLPKTYGKCVECGEQFYVDREQYLFDSMLTTKSQHEEVKRLEREASCFEPWGLKRQLAHQMTILARREKCEVSVSASMAALVGVFARVALKDHPDLLETIGAEGVARSVEAVSLFADVRADASQQLIPLCRVCAELSRQFQKTPSARDIAWGFLQREELAAVQRGAPLWELIGLKDQVASFMRREGRDARQVMRERFRLQCREMKESTVVIGVRVQPPGPGRCAAADRLVETTYSLDAAIHDPPIPCEDCTYVLEENGPPWCACRLGAVTIDSEDLE